MAKPEPDPQTISLADELTRAEAGDVLAAREALGTIAFSLSNDRMHPTTGEPLPVPSSVRDYLARAFEQMAAGVDPRVALHLAGKARSWGRADRQTGADTVAQFVAQGCTVEDATACAAEAIAEWQRVPRKRGRPAPFAGRTISAETLQTWYYELRTTTGGK